MSLLFKNKTLADIYEIRMRKGKPIMLSVKGKYIESDIICKPEYIDEVVLRASKYSIYSVNEQIKAGYIAASGGIRIGICGEVVRDFDGIKTIKNISSINIRLPHEVFNCSEKVVSKCFREKFHSTLVISKPGAGKTTLIRDMARSISQLYKHINILIIDERGEISGEACGVSQFDVGNSDILVNGDKAFGFTSAVRSMRPDIIICDELKGGIDTDAVFEAISCGVYVIATVHANCLDELKLKPNFKEILDKKVFSRYVLLTDEPKVGTVSGIFDCDFMTVS